ncbi:MAG: hypothetical protein NTY23_07340 [Chloroflexi bacterium]|nr:hypothetical protein [Chloroflexota bacterium]
MTFLLDLLSILRWVLVAVAAASIVRYLPARQRSAEFGRVDRALASTFSGLMDAQVLVGVIFLVWNGLAGAGYPALPAGARSNYVPGGHRRPSAHAPGGLPRRRCASATRCWRWSGH